MGKKEKHLDDDRINLGWHDVIAMIIAQMQVLIPILIGFFGIMIITMLLITKVWFR